MLKRCFSPKHYATSGSTAASTTSRRPSSQKDASKTTEKARDKAKPSSAKSSSSSASSSGRSSVLSSRRTNKDTPVGSKTRSDADKSSLETKIKDLMALAKTKDSEIRSLKAKLDQMMLLLQKQQDPESVSSKMEASPPSFTSLVKLTDDSTKAEETKQTGDVTNELGTLQSENMKLREQVDTMLLSMKKKDEIIISHQQRLHGQDLDALSNDDGLSSSLDDLTSGGSLEFFQSASRSTSAENLLECGSGHLLTGSEGCISETSSVTVACLTERIHQMEETHISTNEELEATVQELTDLQKSVPELSIDNNRLQREKGFLMEKLEHSEKKLAEQTAKIDHLRALVSDHLSDGSNHSELKQQYVVLLNEREKLLQVQESITEEVRIAEQARKDQQELAEALRERLRHLERELTHAHTAKSRLEKKLKEVKDEAEEEQSEVVQRLEDELKEERKKVEELVIRGGSNGEERDVIEALRAEKQELEEKYLLLEDDMNQCQLENEKLDVKVAELEEELEESKAKTQKDLSELSEVIDRLQEDLRIKQASLDEANETLFVMEDSVEQHIAVKKHDNHIIQQLQNQISDLKEERFRLEKEIQQLKKEQRNQSEEWKQFQADLQMAVMIANDMKAETQAEVSRLREDNQILDENVTKLRVENEQLRRKRQSSVSSTSAAILEAASLRQGVGRTSMENNIAALRESYKSRRSGNHSPGVQSLIKSFDSQVTAEPTSPTSPGRTHPPLTSSASIPADMTSFSAPFSPTKTQTSRPGTSPVTATVSPMQRHHSMTSFTQAGGSPNTMSHVGKLPTPPNGSASSSKPGTPDSRGSVSGNDLSQLSTLLRRNSNQETRKSSTESRKPLTDILDRLGPSPPAITRSQSPIVTSNTAPPAQKKHRNAAVSTSAGDALSSLARRYGGSKRNALLKWCQEKTKAYPGIDITNFSSSWSDGLALCSLLHSYLPAHIPYKSLEQTYMAATDEKTRLQLQAKNFRLAFAAAESVGIEPTLTTDEMTMKDRPDWQRVMSYVTQVYKYFET
uniref:cytospin-A isoform X2 n=1 Tax=Ciona intestinalis TaxID=7719 RepID=UPI00089DB66A|nr:cytospin-A isoform X2 [Ciona intestinalis]|eukprot:XP_018669640.1 cytospin-A isoform X2 [Ciona intestinalis]